MPQTHVLFIDDSGTKDYSADKKYSIGGRGNSKYFVFCGILLTQGSAGTISQEIIKLKLHYFGCDTVEIKSNWLRTPSEQERYYIKEHGCSQLDLKKFTNDLYELINASDLKLIAAIVNKEEMHDAYQNPWYAPALAYEIILLRVQWELKQNEVCSVIIDDTTGKTPKGNSYKENMVRHHDKLRKYGSSLYRKTKFEGLGTQKFVNSQHSHLVQLADLCAYNVYRQFQMYGKEWESGEVNPLPTYEFYDKIETKFRHDGTGRIQGFGVIKVPEKNKIRWGLYR